MDALQGGFMQGEQQARKLAEPEVRKEIVKLILEAKQKDAEACKVIEKIIEKL